MYDSQLNIKSIPTYRVVICILQIYLCVQNEKKRKYDFEFLIFILEKFANNKKIFQKH